MPRTREMRSTNYGEVQATCASDLLIDRLGSINRFKLQQKYTLNNQNKDRDNFKFPVAA
jgi:hypothetical protein